MAASRFDDGTGIAEYGFGGELFGARAGEGDGGLFGGESVGLFVGDEFREPSGSGAGQFAKAFDLVALGFDAFNAGCLIGGGLLQCGELLDENVDMLETTLGGIGLRRQGLHEQREAAKNEDGAHGSKVYRKADVWQR